MANGCVCPFCAGKEEQLRRFSQIVPEISGQKLYYESEHFYAMPDLYQVTDNGIHLLIISKEHVSSFLMLSEQYDQELLKFIGQIIRKVKTWRKVKHVVLFEKPTRTRFNAKSDRVDDHARMHLVLSDQTEHCFMIRFTEFFRFNESSVHNLVKITGRGQRQNASETISLFGILRNNVRPGDDYLLIQNGAMRTLIWSNQKPFLPEKGFFRDAWNKNQKFNQVNFVCWDKNDPEAQDFFRQRLLSVLTKKPDITLP